MFQLFRPKEKQKKILQKKEEEEKVETLISIGLLKGQIEKGNRKKEEEKERYE